MKRLLAVLPLLLVFLAMASPGRAQSLVPPTAPARGWFEIAFGDGIHWATADAACRKQYERISHDNYYLGATPGDPSAYNYVCHFKGFDSIGGQYGESVTYFFCPSGTERTQMYTCVRREDVVPQCVTCEAGDSQSGGQLPSVGHPISLATGSQWEVVEDYATADGLLAVKRNYSSIQRGRPTLADHEMPGFGWAWHGMIPGRIIIGGSSAEIAEYHSASGSIDFFKAPTSSTSSFIYTEQGVSRRQISMVGSPSGTRMDFFHSGTSVANGSAELRLDFGNGEYILFRRSDVFRLFNTTRYLVPIEHGFPSGYKQWFDYPDTGEFPSKIRDSFSREITIDWAEVASNGGYAHKVISALHLPDGTSLEYQYDRAPPSNPVPGESQYYVGGPQDRLILAKHKTSGGATLWKHSYVYEDPRFPYAITGAIDQNNQRLSTFAYSDAGLAISTERAGGFDKYAVEYLQDNPSLPLQHYVRNVTGPLGQQETYKFLRDEAAPAGMIPTLTQIDRSASPTVPASSKVFTYTNTNGTDFLLSSAQDDRSTTSGMTVDTANRRPTAITEAQGTSVARTTDITWHSQFDLPTHEERQGLTIDSSYSTGGQLLSRTETDTTSQTVPYSTNGQTRTTTYSWDSNGRLLSVNGPLAVNGLSQDDTVTFTYDTNGNRSTMTNGLGQVTNYGSYDANGRPGTITDVNGIVTALSYDGRGRVTTINVKHPSNSSLDAITTLEYDVEGRVIGITRPATEKLIFDYNLAGLLTSMRSADGERTDYVYDAMGNVTSETVKRSGGSQSRSTVRTFDSLGRLLSEALGTGQIRRWAYDANGNVTTHTDPSNNATTQAFDALNRLVSTVAPDGGTTGFAYDQKDGITQNTDPKSVATTFIRNGFGDVIQELSPDRGTSTYWYDAAGMVTRSEDGRGQIVDYSRDVLGRITQKTPQGHSAETITYSWDTSGLSGSYGIGRLGAMADASGTTPFAYDHRGNMLIQQQTVGSTTAAQVAYGYDLGDRVTQITYPSGRIVQYGRDTKGRVDMVQTKASSSVGSWTVIANSITYEPFASVKTMALGNGLSAANEWGNDGRLASRRLYRTSGGTNLSWLTYGYDANDNIGSIIDQLDDSRSVFYGYDVNDRLKTTLLTAATVTPSTDTYSYTSGTNRLSSVANGSGTRTLSYDARGNLAGEARPSSISATTAYDSYARLTGYARTDIGTLSFAYNGRDDRVAMTSSSAGTEAFVYDPDGRVLGQYGSSATDVKAEFIWMLPEVGNDNSPFGGDDGVNGYMPLGVATPDSGGTVQLNWVHGSHLGVPLVTTDASGSAATTPNNYVAPGFPGQNRTLADLYYNRYRDFDPSTGRYIQGDPIGLDGGQNGYVYAGNNPMRWTDPHGLFIPVVVYGAVEGAAAFCLRFPAQCIGLAYGVKKLFDNCQPWLMSSSRPPGYWPADRGAEEWGRRNGVGPNAGRRKFHDIKQGDKGKGKDDYSVNPDTGDVARPDGESAGNLHDD